MSSHQELLSDDYEKQQMFAINAMELPNLHPDFIKNTVFMDESSFSLHCVSNSQNYRIWSKQIPDLSAVAIYSIQQK